MHNIPLIIFSCLLRASCVKHQLMNEHCNSLMMLPKKVVQGQFKTAVAWHFMTAVADVCTMCCLLASLYAAECQSVCRTCTSRSTSPSGRDSCRLHCQLVGNPPQLQAYSNCRQACAYALQDQADSNSSVRSAVLTLVLHLRHGRLCLQLANSFVKVHSEIAVIPDIPIGHNTS